MSIRVVKSAHNFRRRAADPEKPIGSRVCATRSTTVGILRGRVLPPFFGISTSCTAGGKDEPDDIQLQIALLSSALLSETPFTPPASAVDDEA